jgi:hypothetical protein
MDDELVALPSDGGGVELDCSMVVAGGPIGPVDADGGFGERGSASPTATRGGSCTTSPGDLACAFMKSNAVAACSGSYRTRTSEAA